jgi:large repetitive protein
VVAVTANDTDVDGDTLTASVASQPAHGTATCSGGSCTYTPAADYHGPDSFTYRVSDGALSSAAAPVTMTVTSVNDAPVAVDDAASTAQGVAKVVAVTANDTDVDGDTLAASVKTGAAHGTVTCGGGSCTYTPAAGFTGTDSFTYTASDGTVSSAPATVTMTVTPGPANHAPVAVADAATTAEDTATVVPVTANDTDADGDPLTASLVGAPAHGTASCSAGTCRYTPAADFHGGDAFTYQVSDGKADSAVATVTMTVTSVNDAPTARADALTVDSGQPGTIDVLANDGDVDGDALAVSVAAQPAHGTVTCAGTCTYRSAAGYAGPDSFQYRIGDGHGGTATASVAVTVRKVVTLPTEPRKVEATSGSKRDSKVSASVAWKEPKSDGGSPVTDYVVVVLRVVGGDVEVAKKLTVDGDVDSVSVKLPAGRYRFKVAAVTSAGTGPFARLSDAVKAR